MNQPTKLLLAFGVLAATALTRPATADAHFSLSIGLPGFGVFVQEPYPPPVVYAPPVYYPYAPPVAYYYRPAPVFRRGWYGRGRHRGWDRHGRHGDDD
jgi:hypothetical protein